MLRGGLAHPGSGAHGYWGVQLASDPDPFYYRPDLDAPRHPGLLARATRPFLSGGLPAPVHPVLGDHDILVAGEIVPTAETRALAVGDEALWELPPGLTLPPGTSLTAGGSPTGRRVRASSSNSWPRRSPAPRFVFRLIVNDRR